MLNLSNEEKALFSIIKGIEPIDDVDVDWEVVKQEAISQSIFHLDGLGITYREAIKNYKKVDRLKMFLMTRTCDFRSGRSLYKNLSIAASRLIPNALINNKKLSIQVDKLASSLNLSTIQYVANTMGTYRRKEIVDVDCFGVPTLMEFENIKIFCPEKSDKYLTQIYGDWRKLPPEEKRHTNHDYVELNLEKSYLE